MISVSYFNVKAEVKGNRVYCLHRLGSQDKLKPMENCSDMEPNALETRTNYSVGGSRPL